MTQARYDEYAKMSRDDIRQQVQLVRMMSQNNYPAGHENPAGWDGQKLTDDEAMKITKFCAAQDPAIDFFDECNWYLAYLVLKMERVIRYVAKVVTVKLDDAELPRVPEPKTLTMQKNPHPKGSRDWEQYEREAHDFNRFLEIDDSIGEYIVEIQEASNMRVPADAEEYIYNELTRRRLPMTRSNVRRAFFAKWFREVPAGVFTQSEMDQWREEARVDGLSAADYLKENILGTPIQWQQGKR